MNRFRCRMVPVFALMLATACSDDPFGDIQGDLERLVATPTQVFLEIGETETVDVAVWTAAATPSPPTTK